MQSIPAATTAASSGGAHTASGQSRFSLFLQFAVGAVPLALAWLLCMIATAQVTAQGTFANLETPHVKPITTASVTRDGVTRNLVLVCNSADNSVEIYDGQAPFSFLQRVPVGIGPTTVRWHPTLSSFYTCNFDGDSVSRVKLELIRQGGTLVPFGSLIATQHVGDQPADVAFDATGAAAIITLSGRSEVVQVNATTLAIQFSNYVLTADDPTLANIPQLPVPASQLPPAVAPKAPRQLEKLSDGRSFVLNFMSEDQVVPGLPVNAHVDVDVWFDDPLNPTGNANFAGRQFGGLGTTNQAFAISEDGTKMVVVGTLALNGAVGEAAVAAQTFGFVESRMWIVDIPIGQTPSVRPEAPSGMAPPMSLMSRNLNRNYAATAPTPVVLANALSQPSDVVLIPDGAGGIARIAITCFHSDTVTILTVNPATPGGYDEVQIPIPVLSPGLNYSTSGPSGIAYDANTELLFVTCRLDSTLHCISIATDTIVGSAQLNNDPTPAYIRSGREFLYNASTSSESGFVSCASCHLNGTTDGLRWDLSGGGSQPVPDQLQGMIGNKFHSFPAAKGPLVTQTLQGLVNYEVNANGQYLLTNAPYHWRGDRAGFEAFNGAFVSLLGRGSLLTGGQMFAYKQFINSIRHPSNTEQPIDRVVKGTLGTDPDNPLQATGGKLGLQVFHNWASDGPLRGGCVGCHTLPEGSDNVLTEGFSHAGFNSGLETAAMRNLTPREPLLIRSFGVNDRIIALGNAGLTHKGVEAGAVFLMPTSLNRFVEGPVFNYPPGGTSASVLETTEAVTEYVRRFDFALSAAAGIAFTLVGNLAIDMPAMGFFENQVAEANIGMAMIVRSGRVYRGFYFDTSINPPMYREEGTTTLLTRAAVAAFASQPDTAVVIQGTAPGNERRIASPTGIGTQLVDLANAPSNLSPQPMAPMTYHVDIPKFKNNILINTATTPFTVTAPPETSVWALHTLQLSVLNNFGVNSLHHEPPRRMRITGDNIRHGAKLVFVIPTTSPGALPAQLLELDLYPTKFFANGKRIWETEEELGPTVQFVLLNGGPFAPGVVPTAYRAITPTTPPLQPLVWNKYAFAVLNEDGTSGFTPFVPLTVQDVR